jgi:dolichol-phosphate mannosyltransferase
VGFSGVIVNLGTLTLLVRLLHVNPLLSGAVAIEVSIISNFFLNHTYTFRNDNSSNSQHLMRRFGKFNATSLTGAVISFVVFSALYKVAGLHYVLADSLAIIPSVYFNFWASTNFVWKAAKSQRY